MPPIVTLKLTDKRPGVRNKKISLESIDSALQVEEIKKIIVESLDEKPDWTTIMIYVGNRYLEDKPPLTFYNRSKRTVLFFDIFEKVVINLKIRTLQVIGGSPCYCIPLWSYCLRQNIDIEIPDYETVAKLKQYVYAEIGNPPKMRAEELKLSCRGMLLCNDELDLREAGVIDGDIFTLFVPLCFKVAKQKGEMPEAPAEEIEEASEDEPEATLMPQSSATKVFNASSPARSAEAAPLESARDKPATPREETSTPKESRSARQSPRETE